MARILLIGINYAPEMTGPAINTAAMVDLLSKAGHSVEVMTGVPHYPEWRVNPRYRSGLRSTERVGGVAIERFRHYVPRHHSALTRGLYELTFLLNAALFRPKARPDAVIGVVPSLGGGLLARCHAARAKAVWGIVFSDLMGRAASDAGMPGGRSVAWIVSALELNIARAATAVAVIADGFRPYLEAGGVAPSKIYRIMNLNQADPHVNASSPPVSTERAITRRRLGWRQGEVIVMHSGNMGYKQALENLLAAAALLTSDPRYRFVLMGDGNCRKALMRLKRRLSLTNVEFRGLAPSADYTAILEAADILVLNQRATVRDMSLAGKISSYLSAGTPIIAAVASSSESARELDRSGCAIVVPPEDPPALKAAIESVAAQPALRQELGAHGRAYEASRRAMATTLNINGFVDFLVSSRTGRRE